MTLRGGSWLCLVSSVLVPAGIYAVSEWNFERYAAAHPTEGLCGMPMLAMLLLSLCLGALLSLIALGLGIWAYRRLPPPRARARRFELLALALPAALTVLAVGAFFVPW